MHVDLPKWPGFLVVGDKVTEEQAAQIIVRTSNLHFMSNDDEFARKLYAAAGIELEEKYNWPLEESCRLADQHYGCLRLEYLRNQQITSCWIGGPHGWCDWSGNIGCSNSNIGKWPSHEEVLEEWKQIAEAFPYLNLRCQLLSGETCMADEELLEPLVEYKVSNGTVEAYKPKEMLTVPTPLSDETIKEVIRGNRERGCTLEKFKWALSLCERKQGVTA